MTETYWQEESPEQPPSVTDDVVDVLFSLKCRSLPVDHAESLAQALLSAAPWISEEPCCGIHSIHVAGSQNGWQRPDADAGQPLILSRRTKLGIRVPKGRVPELRAALEHRDFDIAGNNLHLETGKERALSRETTIFSRYVCCKDSDSENDFLAWTVAALAELDIKIRKALCGKAVKLNTSTGQLPTRSLMLADLSLEESVRLQQQGLGPHRELGCGLFIPHKGIEAAGPTKG
ncbi:MULTISPECIES: type I-MYXAN CRISPR-associated protein Cas6/Cmx6 [Thiorhodovibrio]|uniref:type I-MYXAN CRISPR-associated protein Cas6/Cmx6 n=1 Tax=Thiorhodovibrio TaxID=61593 RepID=UPI001913CE96|nr:MULTISPECIES: type I-MYXAN CRISPR-associated protein Cas6/Cmx6 [Thiorhodovibrio]MBK5970683.1 type I-MYXAN CRISPR-associated protein Cas6/Cmx6 [Thiorhodovibrio winogradskyi]WPL14227.1 CRISPR-associated endonuclease Cas6 [Thiorhodovibrio litoralis]